MRRRALLAASSNGESGGLEIDTSKYLTIVALEDGVTVKFNNISATGFLEYYSSRYKRWEYTLNVINVTINTNEYLCFRGNLEPSTSGVGRFSVTGAFALEGNCMSLLFERDADTHLSLEGYDGCFYNLFNGCSDLISVSPKFLPATELAHECYKYMFRNCSSLTTAPELPATNLVYGCYDSMFRDCTSLTTAPELPATTLAVTCYYYMFKDCTKLNYIKMLAINISATNCLRNWVDGVATHGTFVKSKNATWIVIGEDGIPKNWTVITE